MTEEQWKIIKSFTDMGAKPRIYAIATQFNLPTQTVKVIARTATYTQFKETQTYDKLKDILDI